MSLLENYLKVILLNFNANKIFFRKRQIICYFPLLCHFLFVTLQSGNKRKNIAMSNRKKATTKAKEPIKLRAKQLANGNQSLYLDFYTDGVRQYEFLKLYLVPEKSPIDKSTNAQTLELANAVKAQKIVELQNTAHGFSVKSGRSKMNVIEYITDIADQKRIKAGGGKRTTGDSYLALTKQIENYSGLKAF